MNDKKLFLYAPELSGDSISILPRSDRPMNSRNVNISFDYAPGLARLLCYGRFFLHVVVCSG